MNMPGSLRPLIAGLATLGILGACSQTPTAQVDTRAAATAVVESGVAVATAEGHFNPTEGIGGGANSSSAVSANDLMALFAAIPQVSQLQLTANSSPPNAKGPDVTSVSINAQDKDGLLKGLDKAGKETLAEAILTASGAAWPNASVSLLVSDPAGSGGQIIGSRPKGGPNTILAT